MIYRMFTKNVKNDSKIKMNLYCERGVKVLLIVDRLYHPELWMDLFIFLLLSFHQ